MEILKKLFFVLIAGSFIASEISICAMQSSDEENEQMAADEASQEEELDDRLRENFNVALLGAVAVGDDDGREAREFIAQKIASEALHEVLRGAVRNGNEQRVRELLAQGASVDYKNVEGETSLLLASRYGHIGVINALIEARADVNMQRHADGDNPLGWAAFNGHTRVVSSLLAARAYIDLQDSDGLTALMLAALHGRVEVVKELLNYGIAYGFNIDMIDEEGRTALAHAVLTSKRDMADLSKRGVGIVALLVHAGARFKAQDRQDVPLLMELAGHGCTDTLNILLTARASVDIQSPEGCTPLMVAARSGHVDTVTMLLHAGAQVNHVDINGSTALMHAVRNNYNRTVRILVWAKARLGMVNNGGLTVMDIASPQIRQVIALAIDEKNDLEVARNVVTCGSINKVGEVWDQMPFEVRQLVGHYLMSPFGQHNRKSVVAKRARRGTVSLVADTEEDDSSDSAKGDGGLQLKRRRS